MMLQIDAHWILSAVLVTICVTQGAALLCSICGSNTDPNCLDNPPPPENCTTTCLARDEATGVCIIEEKLEKCVIIKKLDANDTLLELSRGCIPKTFTQNNDWNCQVGSKDDVAHRICMFGCEVDNCNKGARMGQSVLMVSCLIAMCGILNIL
ncbi:uncharacterized protein LOC135486899 [Lineus longissimus]|uniref:uncharacterized protein LOC135486899 n=1 Tax=Lineus longissimus TaxID=88925 RepID=UPI002B4E89E2